MGTAPMSEGSDIVKRTALLGRTWALLAAATALSASGGAASTSPPTPTGGQPVAGPKLTHAQATSRLRAAGISWTSSGGCGDRNNPRCTSFEQVNLATIQGAEALRAACRCALTITGGTETGHDSGTYSHGNGYKLDYSPTACLSDYIQSHFTYIGTRPDDGAAQYRSGSGDIYARESNHWDVVYYNRGGC
jgi:hypothetical protein